MTTVESVQASLVELAEQGSAIVARQARIAAPLLATGRRIVEGSYAGGYGSVGTTGAGLFGRITAGEVSLLGGLAYGREGGSLRHSVTIAGALRYVRGDGPGLHAFSEAGGWLAPDAGLRLTRHYANGAGVATGVGQSRADLGYFYLRLGAVLVGGGDSELALSGEIGRSRLDVDGYDEPLSNANPFEAHVARRVDRATLYRLRAQLSHGLAPGLDATVWAHAVRADPNGDGTGLRAMVPGIGTLGAVERSRSWGEYGGRLGYAVGPKLVVELFANGSTGERHEGKGIQAGLVLRTRF